MLSLNTKARARLGILEECFIQKRLFCYSFMWLKTCDFFFLWNSKGKICAWFFFQVQWIQSFQTLSKKDIIYCNILKLVIHFQAFWSVSHYLYLEKMWILIGYRCNQIIISELYVRICLNELLNWINLIIEEQIINLQIDHVYFFHGHNTLRKRYRVEVKIFQ